jgi:hypothetical protein
MLNKRQNVSAHSLVQSYSVGFMLYRSDMYFVIFHYFITFSFVYLCVLILIFIICGDHFVCESIKM